MAEPKRCPFCGSAARVVKHSAGMPGTMGYDQWHGVSCTRCNACVGASDRRFRTTEEALAAWDRRTDQQTAEIMVLAKIRSAVGDPFGKLMQDDLVKHIAALYARAAPQGTPS